MKFILTTMYACFLLLQLHAEETPKLDAAENAFNSKEYQDAINLYTQAIELKEMADCSYIYFKRGCCYYSLVNFKAAKADFDRALQVLPDNTLFNFIKGNTLWMYGRLYSQNNLYSKAVKMLLLAKEYNQDTYLYSTLGYEENNLKKYNDALAHLDVAIAIDKRNAYAYSNRAFTYLKLGELDKAREDIKVSMALDSKNPYVYKHSALIYIQLKQYDLACADLQKAKALGYVTFGNEADADDVDKLLKKYCK